MSFLDELGLKAAEQLEQSVGAYVALASYKRLFAAPAEIRGRAVFGALRCAIELGDDAELRNLLESWALERAAILPRETTGGRPASPGALVAKLLAGGRRDLAAQLARAEVDRKPTALSRYILARAREEASGPDLDLWSAVIKEAEAEGHKQILVRSIARWIELSLVAPVAPRASKSLRDEIVSRALAVDLTDASVAEQLVILRARLLGQSRFARASALSALEELARTGPSAIRAHAVLACARDVDVRSGNLEPIEADRARAALRHWTNAAERDSAVQRLDASVALSTTSKKAAYEADELEKTVQLALAAAPEARAHIHRARALASGGAGGGAEAASVGPTSMRLTALGLDIVSALGRGQEAEAQAALGRAADSLAPMAPIPTALWSGARLALRSKNTNTCRAASSFVEVALARSPSSPPFGFVELAADLTRATFQTTAALVLQEALRLKEPGAALALAETQRKLAYAALARGDRARALEALREAKELFARA